MLQQPSPSINPESQEFLKDILSIAGFSCNLKFSPKSITNSSFLFQCSIQRLKLLSLFVVRILLLKSKANLTAVSTLESVRQRCVIIPEDVELSLEILPKPIIVLILYKT
jgi:hypothetical protein